MPKYLGVRRWFAGKGGNIERVEVASLVEVGQEWLLALLRVYTGEGGEEAAPQTYFLPLSAAWEDSTKDNISGLMPFTIAKLRRRSRVGVLYDALADEDFCRALVAAMGEEREVEAGDGVIRFTRTEAFEGLIGDEPLSVRRAGVEQTNTSIILGERLIMKAYRRLQQGVNPDLEIGRYLTEKSQFGNTPPLAGAIEYESADGELTTLALLQGFVGNQGDGWSYVLDYLDRYLEERLVTSWSIEEDEPDQGREEDTFFLGLVHTLGLRTGELHEAFAVPTEDPAFAPEIASRKEVEGWKKSTVKELGRTLKLLGRRRKKLPEAVQAEVDRLLELGDVAEERIKSVATDEVEVVKTRHHGDYHLGQVLVVSNDFQIIDFEGEPARPLEERRMKHSPLRDVAGMLRSFNYAAESAIMDVGAGRADQLEEWVRLWERNVREAFLEGYAEGAREAASYPEDEEHARQLIDLFTLEKALYEIRYELDNRPDWVGIPVKGVLDLIEDSAQKETP